MTMKNYNSIGKLAFTIVVAIMSSMMFTSSPLSNPVLGQGSPGGNPSVSLATDTFGNVFVADGQSLKKYDGGGRYLQNIGGTGNTTFTGALSITTDAIGNVLVADSGSKSIHRFDGSGNLLNSFTYTAIANATGGAPPANATGGAPPANATGGAPPANATGGAPPVGQ
jgi:hypothetical protein